MENKKGISDVTIITLLLLITVGIAFSFQYWGLGFFNFVYSDTEQKTDDLSGIIIVDVVGQELLVTNNIEDNITVERIDIDNETDCLRGTKVELKVGVNRINVSSCSTVLGSTLQNITLTTEKGIVKKKRDED